LTHLCPDSAWHVVNTEFYAKKLCTQNSAGPTYLTVQAVQLGV